MDFGCDTSHGMDQYLNMGNQFGILISKSMKEKLRQFSYKPITWQMTFSFLFRH